MDSLQCPALDFPGKKVDFHKVAYSILQILQHKLQLNKQNVQKIFIATWQTSPNTLAKQ